MSREVILAKTRIGKYYRTTVPSEVRKFLSINRDDEIEWVFANGKIYVRKAGEK